MLSLKDIQSIDLSALVTSTGTQTSDMQRLAHLLDSAAGNRTPADKLLIQKSILNVLDGLKEIYESSVPGVVELYTFAEHYLSTPPTHSRYMSNLVDRVAEAHELVLKRSRDLELAEPSIEDSIKYCNSIVARLGKPSITTLKKFLEGQGVSSSEPVQSDSASIGDRGTKLDSEQIASPDASERALQVFSQITPEMRAALGEGMTRSRLVSAIQLLKMDLPQVQDLVHVAEHTGVSPRGFIALRAQGASHDMVIHTISATAKLSGEYEVIIQELIDEDNEDPDTIRALHRDGRVVPWELLSRFADHFGFSVSNIEDLVEQVAEQRENKDAVDDHPELDDDFAEALQNMQVELKEAPVEWLLKTALEISKVTRTSDLIEHIIPAMKVRWSTDSGHVLLEFRERVESSEIEDEDED